MSTLFASFLGYNPIRNLLRPSGVLARLPARNAASLTGKEFFPHLISGPFHHGLVIVFSAAIVMSVTGALVSLLRGRQFYYDAPDRSGTPSPRPAASPEVTVLPNAARRAARVATERLPAAGPVPRSHPAGRGDPAPADAEP